MSGRQRVAVYAVPGTTAGPVAADPAAVLLRDRAEAWLGRTLDGRAPDPALPAGWTRAAVDAVTLSARRYGFHGTLKAPFRLAEGTDLDQLAADLDRITAAHEPVAIPEATVGDLDGFLAIVPGAPSPELDALAAALVTRLERHRAPATPEEIARRDPSALTPHRRELLAQWGYPYVLDEFRFHLTLTDRIPDERRPDVADALTAWFAGCLGRTIRLDAVGICVQEHPDAPFLLRSVHPLGAPVSVPSPSPGAAASPDPEPDPDPDLDPEGSR